MSFFKKTKSDYLDLDDTQLVAALLSVSSKEKKKALQEVLYERYADKIYYKCISIIRDSNNAKDLSHEVIIKVFLNLHQYKGTGSLLAWILTITYHQCLAYLNKEKKRQTEEFLDIEELIDDGEKELIEKKLLELRLDQLERLLFQLKDAERAILMMYYQDNLSIKKMSTLLSIGESAVKMRLKRSRDHLAKLMNNEA